MLGAVQIDLTRGAILLREHCLETLVETAFEVLRRDRDARRRHQPPGGDMVSVHMILQFGPVLRTTELVDQTIEDRLSLMDGNVDLGSLTRAVSLQDDLHIHEGRGCGGHASLISVLCMPYIIFVFVFVADPLSF